MSQIIADARTGPIGAGTDGPVADVLVITETGSVSAIGLPAVVLVDFFEAFVYGSVTAIDESAIDIFLSQELAEGYLEIGPGGRVTSIEPEGSADFNAYAVFVLDYDIAIVNRGLIEGSSIGILDQGGAVFIENFGRILGQYGITIQSDTNPNTINNYIDGVIAGETYAVYGGTADTDVILYNEGLLVGGEYAVYAEGGLELINTGEIIGGVYVGTASTIASTSGAPPAKIVNTGSISPNDGQDFAITLGSGNDIVKNKGKGAIDGMVALGAGNDRYAGNRKVDEVYGEAGNDFIKTKGGKDVINPGSGKDVILPGRGNDLLVFEEGSDKNVVKGFNRGNNKVDLSDYDFASYAALEDDMSQKNKKVVIDLPASDTVVLRNVELSDLSANDFIL